MWTKLAWRDSAIKMEEANAIHAKAVAEIQACCTHKWDHKTIYIEGVYLSRTKTCKGCGLHEDEDLKPVKGKTKKRNAKK